MRTHGRATLALLSTIVAAMSLSVALGAGAAGAVPAYSYYVGTPLPIPLAEQLAYDPGTHMIYARDFYTDAVLAIDSVKHAVVATIPLEGGPRAIAVDPTTHTVYVAGDAQNGNGVLSLIDETTNTVTATVPVPKYVEAVAVDPQTHDVFVIKDSDTDLSKASMTIIDGATRTVAHRVVVNCSANDVAIDSITHRAYVSCSGEGLVDVFDGTSGAATGAIHTEQLVTHVIVDSASHTVFGAGGDELAIIDGTTDTVTATVSVGYYASGVAFDPVTRTVYVTRNGGQSERTVAVVDLDSAAVTDDLFVGASVADVAVDTATHTVFALTSHRFDSRTFIDTISQRARARAAAVSTVADKLVAQTGTRFGPVPHVLVTDQYGVPYRCDTVTFTIVAGSARFADGSSSSTGRCEDDGVAYSDYLYAGATVGSGKITATVAGVTRPAVLTYQVIPPPAPRLDRTSVGYRSTPATSLASSPVSTSGPGELLVALVQADGPGTGTQRVTAVTGGGLTWTRAAAANPPGQGASEIWQAYATATVTNAPVRARLATSADAAITVRSYTYAAPTLGAVGAASSANGRTAGVDVSPRAADSLVVAGGIDWSAAVRPVPVAGQKIQNYFADRRTGDFYWVQDVTAPTGAVRTPVSVRSTLAGNDRWALVAAEVRIADIPSS